MHVAFASKSELYSKPRHGAAAVGEDLGAQLDNLQFIVCHYAEEVTARRIAHCAQAALFECFMHSIGPSQVAYTALNWVEKNRGRLHTDLVALLAVSDSPLLQLTAASREAPVSSLE